MVEAARFFMTSNPTPFLRCVMDRVPFDTAALLASLKSYPWFLLAALGFLGAVQIAPSSLMVAGAAVCTGLLLLCARRSWRNPYYWSLRHVCALAAFCGGCGGVLEVTGRDSTAPYLLGVPILTLGIVAPLYPYLAPAVRVTPQNAKS